MKRANLLFSVTIALATIIIPGNAGAIQPDELTVDVWLDRGDGAVYNHGDEVTVYFKTNADCFVTLYNIDTDGYINILFPSYPGEGNYVEGGKTYLIPANHQEDFFIIDEATGMGYVEAVASMKPFYLEGWPFYTQRGGDPHHGDEVVDRISGDPFLAIEEINAKILPFGEEVTYADDFSVYYVEEIVSQPRYLCNDCHEPVYYHYDPYYYPCNYIDIVVFDYWWYNRWFYCDYWWVDYSYYYDYYYYAPPPAYLGRRYTRKYGYAPKHSGGYTTKGYGDRGGVVRVNDYYRGKDDYRVDYKPINVEDNKVLSYKLPQTRDEVGYVPKNGITKRGPASDGRGGSSSVYGKSPVDDSRGSPSVDRKSPAGGSGTDYRSGKEPQTKTPVYDRGGREAEGRTRTTGKTSVLDRQESPSAGSQVKRSGTRVEDPRRSRPESGAAVRNKASVKERERSRPESGAAVRNKASVQERERSRPESRKEYQLRGWDRAKSSGSKRSSGISIIKSPKRSSSASRGRAISSGRSSTPRKSVSRSRPSSSGSRGSRPTVRRK